MDLSTDKKRVLKGLMIQPGLLDQRLRSWRISGVYEMKSEPGLKRHLEENMNTLNINNEVYRC